MSDINLEEVLKRLIGKIEPVGDSTMDAKRLDNLKVYTALADHMLDEIAAIRRFENQHQSSMKAAGKHCVGFFNYIKSEYTD